MFTNASWKYVLGVLLVIFSLNAQAQSPSVTIVPSGPIVCAGSKLDAVTVNLNQPITYLWSNGATTSSINIFTTGFYRVRVTGVDNNGATVTVRSAWYPFLVIPQPNASISANGPLNLCPGQSVTLTANGGQFFSSFDWSNGATTRNTTVSQTGDYTVTISNNFGSCNATSSATVHVEQFDAGYVPAIIADGPITVCQPGYINLHADSGFTNYLWSTGSTSQAVSILMDGTQAPILDTMTVTLSVTINNLCTFTNTDGVVIRSVREPKLGTNYCGNFGLTATDSIRSEVVLTYLNFAPQYDFEFEETSNPGVTWNYLSNTRWCNLANVTPAIQANKFYNVRIRAVIAGIPYCYGAFCQIGVVPNGPVLENENNASALRVDASNELGAVVFPNPSAESFKLVLRNINADQPAIVRVSDVSGRLVGQYTYDATAGYLQFGESLNNGIYLVTVEQGNAKSISRVVKTN